MISGNKLEKIYLYKTDSIQHAIECLNEVGYKIVLVKDEDNKFVGTISDGDIRRGILNGINISAPILSIVNRKPLVVSPEIGVDIVMQLMILNHVQQIPVVKDGFIHGIHLLDEVLVPKRRNNRFIIMAGGFGRRMLPYTEACPKPMLKVAGRPILEHIIDRAKNDGFEEFIISIGYLGEIIEKYFENGHRFGVNITYIREEKPLGTAGALSLLSNLDNEPVVVTNGDVITDLSYADLLGFHIKNGADATMAVRSYEWQNPFGVVEVSGLNLIGIKRSQLQRDTLTAEFMFFPGTCCLF